MDNYNRCVSTREILWPWKPKPISIIKPHQHLLEGEEHVHCGCKPLNSLHGALQVQTDKCCHVRTSMENGVAPVTKDVWSYITVGWGTDLVTFTSPSPLSLGLSLTGFCAPRVPFTLVPFLEGYLAVWAPGPPPAKIDDKQNLEMARSNRI